MSPDALGEASGITASLLFASAACSRRPRALAVLPSRQLAAYISDCNVFVVDASRCAVTNVIAIRASPLNAVKLLLHRDTPYILVCAEDGYITLCRQLSVASETQLAFVVHTSFAIFPTACLAFDTVSVDTIDDGVFVAAVSEQEIRTCVLPLKCRGSDHAEISARPLPTSKDGQPHLCHDAVIHPLGPSSFFIALGGTERLVRLYHTTATSDDLTLLVSIPGHRDWVRTLAFATDVNGETILATASTDTTVRLFRIRSASHDMPVQPLRFNLGTNTWFVHSFALLEEHSGPVHTVSFSQPSASQSTQSFLTASLDGTIAVWSLSSEPTCVGRFGLMGGHAAHASGFFAAAFLTSTSPHTILAAGFSGAFHRWEEHPASEFSKSFVSRPAFGGHHAPVSCVRWAPNGAFLMSASHDKTVRVFADGPSGFVECARPQVHGHAVNAIAFCDKSGARYVSASEERMLRVFDAPASFRFPNGDVLRSSTDKKNSGSAVGAVLPELGLSNKAVLPAAEDQDDRSSNHKVAKGGDDGDMDGGMRIVPIGADRGHEPVPLEDELKQSLLWPEVAKLYGHGNEITCLTSHILSATIASAGKGFSVCDAAILIWDANTGVETASLNAHDYSVVDLRFSPDGRRLVSVGKDRTISVHERAGFSGMEKFEFRQICNIANAHRREIFGCAWLGSDIIATGARDKTVKLFSVVSNGSAGPGLEISKHKFADSVTAIASTETENCEHVLALGLDSGSVVILLVSLNDDGSGIMSTLFNASEMTRCGGTVTSLHWRPKACNEENGGNGSAIFKRRTRDLAIGSKDQSLRVVSLDLENGGQRLL